MPRPMSREERKQAVQRVADIMFEQVEAWYDEHPDATFEELEDRIRQARREMMGSAMAVFVNGRNVGKVDEAPLCEQCGQAMRFKGYRTKKVYGLEGDTELERAYYVCVECDKQAVFPPG